MAKRNPISEVIKRIEKGIEEQDLEIARIVERTEKELLDLNKQQLFQGVDSNNKSLGKYKSKSYALFKRMLNPQGVVDLYLTGKFYAGFFIRRYIFPVEISSRDKKTKQLTSKYGEAIFGHNQESKEIYAKSIFLPRYLAYWKKVLHIR